MEKSITDKLDTEEKAKAYLEQLMEDKRNMKTYLEQQQQLEQELEELRAQLAESKRKFVQIDEFQKQEEVLDAQIKELPYLPKSRRGKAGQDDRTRAKREA